jgi:hypothetical protein
MTLIESTEISNLCNYSFGDYASVRHNLKGAWMKEANISNREFIEFVRNFDADIVTLFIDNVRLYNRKVFPIITTDKILFERQMEQNDLLELCAHIANKKFIIFTGHEDLEIDETIHHKIPDNVLKIFAINAKSFGGKVVPLYYGVQRKLRNTDNRKEVLLSMMDEKVIPTKLLYVNHSVYDNVPERIGVKELFANYSWATVAFNLIDYTSFLFKIKEHRFVICPQGNAIDCHRNYEVLYMRRVPIMLRNEYLEYLYRDLPVLWVKSWSEITEKLLIENNYLFERMKYFDLDILDVNNLYHKCLAEV